MIPWLRGKCAGLLAFFVIAALVAGGLGWATHAALRLESDHHDQKAAIERADRLRLALWRLDSRMTAALAAEDVRSVSQYSAVFAPAFALDGTGRALPPGLVLQLSPLLAAELPPWMLLHFQADESGWQSPQVLDPALRKRLRVGPRVLGNVTEDRKKLLASLSRELPPAQMLALLRSRAGRPTIRDHDVLARLAHLDSIKQTTPGETARAQSQLEWACRAGHRSKLVGYQQSEDRVAKNIAVLNFSRNGVDWLDDTPIASRETRKPAETATFWHLPLIPVDTDAEVNVSRSSMVGLWLPCASGVRRLVVVRLVRVEEKDICQGIVLDGDSLMSMLREEVLDLFPTSCITPALELRPDLLDRTMTTLPLRLDPGPMPTSAPAGWTPLRIGLSLAWAAALIALLAVGLGGRSLLALSERRIRFVSAVTHELRTPLTTLRLYLDLLQGGMVREEKVKQEYLETMQAETDRLTRLVNNVLDYSRLENQTRQLALAPVTVAEVLARSADAWRGRCALAGKELVLEDSAGEGVVQTDADLLQQVLGNLLENACKYSHEAEDRRLWLRARRENGRVVFEVEDRGPGVPVSERHSIFTAFRRGKAADATTGGVGLGLALARWWTQLLGGRLTLHCPSEGGACFRVELPISSERDV